MRPIDVMVAAQMVVTQDNTLDRIVNDAADRAEDIADFLEGIENSIKEDSND
jgi:hypothetical protein